MRTLQERLKHVMAGPPKVSQAALARACGIRAPSVNDWLSGKTKTIEGQNLLLAADFLKVMPMWLATGRGPMRKDSGAEDHSARKEGNVVAVDFAKSSTPPGYVTIPQFAVSASMGYGTAPPQCQPDVIRDMTVHLDWLVRRGVSYSKLENLAIITGDGDSMEGTFSDGASLLVDMGITEIRTDAIYVFTLDGDLFIKRLQRITGRSLWMISDNPKYKPVELAGDKLDRMHVHARVLLIWDVKKV